ncbi:hypothetical protein ACFQ0I_01260 [Mariniflexile aquimaris]|uniref:DUF916 domain-containing protein n=1 Tax=Mariniflexile aquimaris TaxID=881009 RepID=A0ABW3BMS4_9FLAO
MKSIFYKYFAFALIVGLSLNTNSFAQNVDVENYRMMYNFKTVKNSDNARTLEVSFIARNKEDRKDNVPVFDAEIKFFNTLNDEEVLIGTSKTNNEGIARLILPENHKYLADEDGYINLKALFEGTDAIDEQEETLSVKNLYLELDLQEIDSVKTVFVKAYLKDSEGTILPVEECDIRISVNGMISRMKIEDGTIENGEFEFEMPTNIPGDANGNYTVFAIIQDHDEFATVIQEKNVNWGVFTKLAANDSNTLWSEAAPIWMYIVLTILLVGVWANYAYTIKNLFSISKEGKELKMKTKE